ncbi:pyridoxal phosphate-dependent aminotransferase [Microbacterium sp. RD1]|uniref:pyridoxal phosphate-dependent aminotransferase n=1 Tax=Microbacterium sp. RD1 TaxID=3457313 RepID=UPI003FA5F334
MPAIAPHIAAMPGSGVRRILEIALRRPGTLILAVGEPGEAVAPRIRSAGAQGWTDGATRYTPNGGIRALREAIVGKLARENGVDAAVEQVLVTVGGTQALHQAMSLVLAAGDDVLIPDPGYTTFAMNAAMLQARAVPYLLRPERAFTPDLDELERLVTPRTRAIIVNSPSNPLGITYSAELIAALVAFARRHDLWLISDEVYERFTWGAAHVSPASLDTDGRVLSVFSTSKTYAMTGVRVGWLVTPPGLEDAMLRAQEATVSCVDGPAQLAALEALTGPQDAVASASAHYAENLRAAVSVLDAGGFRYLEPSGAFYLWIDMAHVAGGDVAAWCEQLLDEQGVAVAPGSAFGASGEGWIRVCVASDRAELLEGLRRLPVPPAARP